MTDAPWFAGLRVRRVDRPSSELWAITVSRKGEQHVLVLSTHPGAVGAGLVTERPRGQPADGVVRRLRTALTGGVWDRVTHDAERGLLLGFRRGGAPIELWLRTATNNPRLSWLDEMGNVVAVLSGTRDVSAATSKLGDLSAVFDDSDSASRAGGHLLHAIESGTEDRAMAAVRNDLRRRLKRARRKRDAIQGDIDRAEQSGRLRIQADTLMCQLGSVPKGATEVELPDAHTGESTRIPLNPALDARRNAEALYRRAGRLERGVAIARQRLAMAQEEVTQLETQAARAAQPDAEASQFSPLSAPATPGKGKAKRGVQAARVPYRSFVGHKSSRILVGRGARDNDELTLKVASPRDHWLHARGSAGAHVIVPRAKNQPMEPELLVDAALLAAHFSAAKSEDIVEVAHTPRRYVRKPKGSPAGRVHLDREKVLTLRVDRARTRELLATENRETKQN